MRNDYYNASHCADPTAFAAINNVTREERRVNRKPRNPGNRRRKRRGHQHKQ